MKPTESITRRVFTSRRIEPAKADENDAQDLPIKAAVEITKISPGTLHDDPEWQLPEMIAGLAGLADPDGSRLPAYMRVCRIRHGFACLSSCLASSEIHRIVCRLKAFCRAEMKSRYEALSYAWQEREDSLSVPEDIGESFVEILVGSVRCIALTDRRRKTRERSTHTRLRATDEASKSNRTLPVRWPTSVVYQNRALYG